MNSPNCIRTPFYRRASAGGAPAPRRPEAPTALVVRAPSATDGLHHALRGARDEAGVAAQHDEAVAARDHRTRVIGGEGDAAQRDLAVSPDLRLRLRHDLAEVRMVELARHTEALREIATRDGDHVEPADREDVVERVHADLRLDQHDVQ